MQQNEKLVICTITEVDAKKGGIRPSPGVLLIPVGFCSEHNLYLMFLAYIIDKLLSPSQRTQAALQAVNAVQSGGMALTGAPMTESGLPPGQSSVLRIIVENLFYPVTLEVLYQV